MIPIKMLLLILTLLPLVSGRCAPYWGSLKCASCVTLKKHGWGRKPCGWNTATSQCEKANAESASLQTTVDMCAATTTSTSSPALLSDNGATTTPLLRRGRGSSLDFTDQPYAGSPKQPSSTTHKNLMQAIMIRSQVATLLQRCWILMKN